MEYSQAVIKHSQNTYLINALNNALIFSDQKVERFSRIYIKSLNVTQLEVTSTDGYHIYKAVVEYDNHNQNLYTALADMPIAWWKILHKTKEFTLDNINCCISSLNTNDSRILGHRALEMKADNFATFPNFSLASSLFSKLSKIKALDGKKLDSSFRFLSLEEPFFKIGITAQQSIYSNYAKLKEDQIS